MNYLTIDDLIARFGNDELLDLAEHPTNAGQLDNQRIETAITDAESEIDSILVTRYVVPLTPVPALVPRLASDMVRYYLQENKTTDEALKRYEQAIKALQDIALGLRDIAADATNTSSNLGMEGKRTSSDRLFTKDTLSDF